MGAWERPGASDEWYTPKYIFDALGCRFDMDVAAPWVGRNRLHVPTDVFLSETLLPLEDVSWFGFVWMNPPYGGRNSLTPWLDKFVKHGNGVALVPDRTSAPWFQAAAPLMDAILFVSPKIKFERPDGTLGEQPANGTALMAIGAKGVGALNNAKSLGFLVQPLWCSK